MLALIDQMMTMVMPWLGWLAAALWLATLVYVAVTSTREDWREAARDASNRNPGDW